MCFEAINSAGMDVENERVREHWMQNQRKLKEQTAAAAKGKKQEQKTPADNKKPEPPKPSGIQKKKTKSTDKKKTSVSSDKSKATTKREKEPGEDKVTYHMKQIRMKEGVCIKCGSKDHIKKDCTVGWKPVAETKGKGKDKVDGKKVAVVQAAVDSLISSVTPPVSFGRIISEDELDYECD
jgi:hypothetical protein